MGLLAIGGWLVAAVLAVGISWSAIDVVRDSVGASQPVATALPPPSEASTSASPSSTRPTAAPTAGGPVVKAGRGGTVTARCVNGQPQIVNAAPRQGFRVETDDSGNEVQFRSSDHRTEMTVSCSGLTATVQVDEHSDGGGGGGGDDHGGGRGGGSGSGRGGGHG